MAPARRVLFNRILGSLVLAVVVMGISRSRSRHGVWHNNNTLWGQTLIDAPRGYRAWTAFGSLLDVSGNRPGAIAALEESLRLWDRTTASLLHLADWRREGGRCDLAIPLYRQALDIADYAPARTHLIACLVRTDDYQGARAVALQGVGEDFMVTVFRTWVRTIDRAIRLHLPPDAVKYDPSLLRPDAALRDGG